MLKYFALVLVLWMAVPAVLAGAAPEKVEASTAANKAASAQDASADSDSPIAGQDSGPTFIYNTQKEQQKDKWDKAAVVSHFVLAGVGAIGLVLAFLILNKLKRQIEVLEQTVVLQHRPRLQIRRIALDPETQEIAFTIANAGGTKAFVSSSRFLARAAGNGGERLEGAEDAASIGEFYLKPGEEQRCSIEADGLAAPLVVMGVLWYRDTLGIERSLGVHRVLEAGSPFFAVVSGSDAEYSD